MAWNEHSIENWTDLVAEFDKLDYGRPAGVPFLFRGQANTAWLLEDSLSRLVREVNRDLAYEFEYHAYTEFVSQAHLFLDHASLPENPKNPLEWWARMQHYRAPTRLLDWTSSPYIALYFAVSESWDNDGVVWAFDPVRLVNDAPNKVRKVINEGKNIVKTLRDHETPQLIHPYTVRKLNPRQSIQQGAFTLCTVLPADHGKLIDASLKKPGWHHKYVIKFKLKAEFLRRLRRMNINASSLFPGADGLGASIREIVQMEVRHASQSSPE